MINAEDVPLWLRRWFVVNFSVDLVVAVPLFVAPRAVLGLLGWIEVDPAMARVVACAVASRAAKEQSCKSAKRYTAGFAAGMG